MFRVCIDTGGTFTDCVVLDETNKLHQFKSPSTPYDYSDGILNALSEAATYFGKTDEGFIREIELIMHGTTVATNALITRNLAKTALITTKGFRDIIEMRRALKIETKSMYEAIIPPYEPIVPRYLRFGIDEETRYTGEITRPVNEIELKSVIENIKKEGIEAVAICFINSYVNSQNEQKAAQICRQELEGVFITYSSEILPIMGEYTRESTCVINASIGPVVLKYLTTLEKRLAEIGFSGQLLMVQANQFAQSIPALIGKPVYLIGSGPSAAPAGGAFLSKLLNEPNFITGDVGGTTFDASLVINNEVALTAGKWLNDERLGIKVVDVTSIGAGGGSIAWVNSLGLLQVGPQSAGAEPGPACYGKGGDNPTVTDAAVILGYIPDDYFWEGKLRLSVDLAKSAVAKVAKQMNMSIEETAEAIIRTTNSAMADGIAEISTKMGHDVRDFSLLTMGGAGPVFGAFLANLCGINKVIVPRFAASFSAWGMFTLDIGRDYSRPFIRLVDNTRPEEINALYEEMITEALKDFAPFNISRSNLSIVKTAEIRYQSQYHEVEIELPIKDITHDYIEKLADLFHQKHEDRYTFALPWLSVEIRNLRLITRIKTDKISPNKISIVKKNPRTSLKKTKLCIFNNSYVETPCYDSNSLSFGDVIEGPALIEEPLTTVVIPEEFRCDVDDYGNYIILRKV